MLRRGRAADARRGLRRRGASRRPRVPDLPVLLPSLEQADRRIRGDVNKRAKFGVDIVRLAREKLGRAYPILFRISGSEIDGAGLTTDDTAIIARRLQDAGVDCIDVSAGYYGTSEWVSQPAFMKPGCIVQYAREIKPHVDVPVITVARSTLRGSLRPSWRRGLRTSLPLAVLCWQTRTILSKPRKGERTRS